MGGALRHLLRHFSPLIRSRGVVIKRFASKIGLVYFGAVDQDDDHEVIRGLTVSTTHRDAHYAVGSFDGYDVSTVDRFDATPNATGQVIEHSWLIFQVSLTDKSLPHLFFKPLGHSPAAYNRFFNAFNTLHIINESLSGVHSNEFHARYELYGAATHALNLESSLSAAVTQTVAARFWPHAVEIYDGKLYVYITEHRLTETVLAATLDAAVWLASALDNRED